MEDTLGNLTTESVLGSFEISISIATDGLLEVTPAGNLAASGPAGGPFSPDFITYTLTNSGGTSLNWSAAKTQSWVALDKTTGSLAPGASTTVTASITTGANALAAGNYSDTVSFTNTTTASSVIARLIDLKVTSPPRIVSMDINEQGMFQMLIVGTANQELVIEASIDSEEWKLLATSKIGIDGTLTFTDPESVDLPTRFYRVGLKP